MKKVELNTISNVGEMTSNVTLGQPQMAASQNQEIASNKVGRKPKRAKALNLWRATNVAKRHNEKQIMKTSDVKLGCLTLAFADDSRLWSAFNNKVEQLTDSMKFTQKCKELKLDAKIAATHIVFDGYGAFNDVSANGFNPAESQIDRYKESFINGAAIKTEKE